MRSPRLKDAGPAPGIMAPGLRTLKFAAPRIRLHPAKGVSSPEALSQGGSRRSA